MKKTNNKPAKAPKKASKAKQSTPKQKTNEKTKKALIITSIAIIVLLTIGAVAFSALYKKPGISSEKIMDELKTKISSITDIINYSDVTDPNNILGKANQYTSKSSWEDSRLSDITEEHAGTIEVFRNAKDAEIREWKLNKTDEECRSTLRADIYGEFMANTTCNGIGYGTTYRDGAVIIRLSRSFSNSEVEKYKKYLATIIGSYAVPSEDIPNTERVEELKKEADEAAKEAKAYLITTIESGLDDIMNTYSDKLTAISVSLNEDDLANAEDDLSFFKSGSYFSSRLVEFEGKIKEIKAKIDAQKAAEQAKKDQEAAAKLASKNRTFGAGKYTACTDIDSGTYDIVALSGGGNLFVHSSTYSHYINEILYADGSYGRSSEYKNAKLSCGDELEIRSTLVVQLTAKN